MSVQPTVDQRYRLSFGVGGLFEREASIAVPLFGELCDWTSVRSQLVTNNLLQARTQSTAVRYAGEVIKRLETLTNEELVAFSEFGLQERRQLMWVAACRAYSFIAEFAEEVLRDRFLGLKSKLTLADYDAFVLAKSLWHNELNEISELTYGRLRRSIFQMLRDTEMLNDAYEIQSVLLTPQLRSLLDKSFPSDIRFFPVRSIDESA